MGSIVCAQFCLDLSLRSADYVAHWIEYPAAFLTGMAVIHDAVAPALTASTPLGFTT